MPSGARDTDGATETRMSVRSGTTHAGMGQSRNVWALVSVQVPCTTPGTTSTATLPAAAPVVDPLTTVDPAPAAQTYNVKGPLAAGEDWTVAVGARHAGEVESNATAGSKLATTTTAVGGLVFPNRSTPLSVTGTHRPTRVRKLGGVGTRETTGPGFTRIPMLPLNAPEVALKDVVTVTVARAPNVTLGDGGKLMLVSGALLQSWLWNPAPGELVDRLNTVPAGGVTGVPSWRVNVTVTITQVPATMVLGPCTRSALGSSTAALLDIPPMEADALVAVAPEEDAPEEDGPNWDDPALTTDDGPPSEDPGVDDENPTPLLPPLASLEATVLELGPPELGPLDVGPLDGCVLLDARLLPDAPVAVEEDPPTLTPPEDVVVVMPGWQAPSTQLSVTEHWEALLQDKRHSPSRSTCALGQVVCVQETPGAPSATATNSQPKCRIRSR